MKGNNFSSSSTILDKIDGKFRPPQSKDGKMTRGMGVCCSSLFCPVASCSGQSDERNKLVRPTEIFFTDVDNTMNRWGVSYSLDNIICRILYISPHFQLQSSRC